jgi:hypothetical protein
LGVLVVPLFAAPALGTELLQSVVSSGGVDLAAGNKVVRCTVGQACIGRLSGAALDMKVGFWQQWMSSLTDVTPQTPLIFGLDQNYPNPFNPSTSVVYTVAEDSHIQLNIYDLRGRRVAMLVNGEQPRGIYTVQWNGRDDFGRGVASGTYFVRLETREGILTRKMLLAR